MSLPSIVDAVFDDSPTAAVAKGARKRVLLFIKNLQQGGTERQFVQLLRSLDPARFEVHACLFQNELHYDDIPPTLPTYVLDAPELSRKAIGATAELIDRIRPDLIHTFRDRVNATIRLALTRTQHQPAWMMSVRGRPILPADLAMIRLMSPRAYRITANSEGIATALGRFAGVPRDHVAVTHNLVNLDEFGPSDAAGKRRAREQLGLPQDAFVWTLPARISHLKNQVGLVAGLALLLRRWRAAGGSDSDFVVHLPGRVRDPLAGRLLATWSKRLGVAGLLRIDGPTRDLQSVYAAADALILPSWAEGMPNVSLEAHLSGLPIVTTYESNRDGIVEPGLTGFEMRLATPWALADNMAGMMRLSPDERAAMGAAGRQRVLALFDRQVVLERLTALYLEAIAAGPPKSTSLRFP